MKNSAPSKSGRPSDSSSSPQRVRRSDGPTRQRLYADVGETRRRTLRPGESALIPGRNRLGAGSIPRVLEEADEFGQI